jgi:hypothetical protein
MHKLSEEGELVAQRIAEKLGLATDDRFGDSLEEVENFQLNHRTLETDVAALGKDVAELTTVTATALRAKYAAVDGTDEQVAAVVSPLVESWAVLEAAVAARHQQLVAHSEMQQWVNAAADFKTLVLEVLAECQAQEAELATRTLLVPEAETLIETHQKRISELAAQVGEPGEPSADVVATSAGAAAADLNTIEATHAFADVLVGRGHAYSEHVQAVSDELRTLVESLNGVCAELATKLEHRLGVARFNELTDEASDWIGKRQAMIDEADEHGSVEQIDNWMGHHEDIESSTQAFIGRIQTLCNLTAAEASEMDAAKRTAYKQQLDRSLEASEERVAKERALVRASEEAKHRMQLDRETALRDRAERVRQEKAVELAEAARKRRVGCDS